jgi:hypothetical protein
VGKYGSQAALEVIQHWKFGTTMTRDMIDDAAWALIAPFLPLERVHACRPSTHTRRGREGVVRIAHRLIVARRA